jgi:hypothetical protein
MGGHHWPAEIARAVGKDQESTKKLLSRMRDAGQVGDHSGLGYAAPGAA